MFHRPVVFSFLLTVLSIKSISEGMNNLVLYVWISEAMSIMLILLGEAGSSSILVLNVISEHGGG